LDDILVMLRLLTASDSRKTNRKSLQTKLKCLITKINNHNTWTKRLAMAQKPQPNEK